MKCKPFNAMSMGIFGNVELTISWRSNSFSSMKCSSLPPPLANLKGMLSPVWKPYRGYKGNQKINKHQAGIHTCISIGQNSNLSTCTRNPELITFFKVHI